MKTNEILLTKNVGNNQSYKMICAILCVLINTFFMFGQPPLASYRDGTGMLIHKIKALKNYIPNTLHNILYGDIDDEDAAGDMIEVVGNFDGKVLGFTGKYTATLILENDVVEVQDLSVKKSMFFVLQKNKMYTIKINKEGYISKYISFYTFMPQNTARVEEPYVFMFETNLLSMELKCHFNDDDIDFPVALVSYNKDCDCFEYNKKYTNSLRNRMFSDLFFGL